jgi:small-conductance mechanosensitive channel
LLAEISRLTVAGKDHLKRYNRLIVNSELHQEIDRRFREAKIEIAFPQRDLHLRSMDESVVLKPTKTIS